MKLKDIYKREQGKKNFVVSYEVFPSKDGNLEKLYGELEVLKAHNPSLVSITYGAGGSNRNSSLEIVKYLKNEMKFNVMPHFTCVCSSKESIDTYLSEIEELGIENILALRGDEPKDIDVCHLDFKYANELVNYIQHKTTLSIGVAGYPEGHIDAVDIHTDIENLKRKCDNGADVIYTQMFFDNDKYFKYIQLVQDAGIDLPVIPGILPITSFSQLDRMLSMARVTMPKTLLIQLEKYKDDNSAVRELGIDFASYQCQQLYDAGVAGLHFYTLNKAYSVNKILLNLIPEHRV